MKMRIWNDNTIDYKENFRGNEIVIKAGKYIDMEWGEGNIFVSTFVPPVKMANGNPDPNFVKMLRRERIADTRVDSKKIHKCMMCGDEHKSEFMLKAHIADEHKDFLADSDVGEALDKEIAQGMEPKRKRGRPAKNDQTKQGI
jgi:hypothetical protein